MSKSHHTVCVRTPPAVEYNSTLQPNTKAWELFEQIAKTLNLRQVEFFGLSYKDLLGERAWAPLNKKVFDRPDLPKQSPLQLHFSPKYFPEDVRSELVQAEAVELFYHHVRASILSDEIYSPPSTSILLAALILQVKFGDYEKIPGKEITFDLSHLVPRRVLHQHKLTKEEWEQRMIEWWTEQKGKTPEAAMMEYLRTAQTLEMYGITYFEIGNRRGTHVLLGVHALGLSIYQPTDRLNPKIIFPWAEIYKILYINRRFIIRPMNPKEPDLVFIARRERTNKRIFHLSVGNHELYRRRRSPDGPGVKFDPLRLEETTNQNEREMTLKLREKADAVDKERERERQEFEKLKEAELEAQMQEMMKQAELERRTLESLKEVELRQLREEMEHDAEANEAQLRRLKQEIEDRDTVAKMKARQREHENEERVKRIQEELDMWQKQSHEGALTIRRLQSELQRGNEMKGQLEVHRRELLALVEHLTSSRELELEERRGLAEEIQRREDIIRLMETKVKEKEEETIRLEEEAIAASQRQEEVLEAMRNLKIQREASSSSSSDEEYPPMSPGLYANVQQQEGRGQEVKAEEIENGAAEKPKKLTGLELYYQITREERANARQHEEILQARQGIAKPIEAGGREDSPQAYYEIDERQQKKLRRLTQELAGVEIEGLKEAMTAEDKAFKENFRLGRDNKYDTLRRVREGNTKRRVDMFENM